MTASRASNVLAIDPGAKGHRAKGPVRGATGCACAWFENGVLQGVRFETSPRPPGGPLVVVVERPQVDQRTRYADTRDVLALAWAGARAAYYAAGVAGGTVVEYTPAQWKGEEPKPVQHARVWAIISAGEREALGGYATGDAIEHAVELGALSRWRAGEHFYPAGWDTHNLLDAAALGLFYLGRLAKR